MRFNAPILKLAVIQWMLSLADNAVKSAFGFLIVFKSESLFGLPNDVALMIGALAFALPYVLFAGIGGQLARKISCSRLVHLTRVSEVPLALVTAIALSAGHVDTVLFCLFFYSAQTAIFAPAKLGLLPQIVAARDLVSSNATLQFSTLFGALTGLLVGGLFVANHQVNALALILVALSLAGYLSSRRLPRSLADASYKIAFNPLKSIAFVLRQVFAERKIALLSLSITWFWVIGMFMTTILPDVANTLLNATGNAANLMIAAFVIGIAIGGIAVTVLARRLPSSTTVKYAAVLLGLVGIELVFALHLFAPGAESQDVFSILGRFQGLRILADLVLLAALAAVFISPLYTALQLHSPPQHAPVLLAGSVTLDAGVNTLVAAGLAAAFALGATFPTLLFGVGLLSCAVGIGIIPRIQDLIDRDQEGA